MATHSSVLAWRIPGTGAWWAAVYGVIQSQTRLKCSAAAVACVYLYTIYLCKRQVEYLCEPEMEQKPRAVG